MECLKTGEDEFGQSFACFGFLGSGMELEVGSKVKDGSVMKTLAVMCPTTNNGTLLQLTTKI
jgi:hypothetical protein